MAQFDPFADPRTVGILGMASGLLEGAGASRLPVTLGQAMGQGIQRGILDRGAAEEIATRKMLREAQARRMQQEQAQQEYLKTLFAQITDPQERLFAQINPQAWVQSKLKPEATKLMERDPTKALVHPMTGQVVSPATMQAQAKPSSDEALLQAAGYTPGTPEYQAAARELLKKKSEFAPIQNSYTFLPAIGPDGKPTFAPANTKTGEMPPGLAPMPRSGRQVPPTIAKAVAEEAEEIGIAASTQADLNAVQQQLQTGELNLGPVQNVLSQARNIAGVSTEQSRNFQSLKATLEKLRNDSLRLNKGVQTEGDAQRAWNELLASMNDPKVVMQRLGEIQRINERAVELRKLKIETLQQPYGGSDAAIGERAADQPAAIGTQLPKKGDVVDGWEFIGGDPANRMNWRKQK